MEVQFLVPLVGIFILIVIAAFFSAAETAMTSASRVRLHSRALEGNRRAALVTKIRGNKDRMIGALLLGNNIVNILSSAVATSVLIGMFGQAGVVYATIIMTVLLVVFSEVLPKTYAFHHAETVSMRIAPIVSLVIAVFAPITDAMTWIVSKSLRMFGVDMGRVHGNSHLELLRGAIDLHDGPDEVWEQRAMLRSILDLAEVTVGDIMIHRKNVAMVNADDPIDAIVEDVLASPFTRIPVWRNKPDNIEGILHTKRLLRAVRDAGNQLEQIVIKDIALEPWFIPETTTLFHQLQAFRERREHFAIVVDEYGVFMGIVTLEDILEEIVGDIDDEQDITVPGVRKAPGGHYLIDGEVTIRDLNREFNWRLPDEDYSTLAGLILYEAQMVPHAGQTFSFHNCRFEILKRHRNQITQIKVTPPTRKTEPAAQP